MMGVSSRPVHSAASTRSSGTSGSFDMDTKRYNHPSSCKSTGRRMIYTGPGTTLFHRVSVGDQGQYIGSSPSSNEITSAAAYLYRPSPNNLPSCLMRHQRIGEIGWNVTKLLKNSVLPVVIEPGRR